MKKVQISDKLAEIGDFWSPVILAQVNNHDVRLAKVKGSFTWHQHPNEDEMFMVLKGKLKILFRDKEVVLSPMEVLVIPKGVEHCPVAEEETHILLFEPSGTRNTGNVENAFTKDVR